MCTSGNSTLGHCHKVTSSITWTETEATIHWATFAPWRTVTTSGFIQPFMESIAAADQANGHTCAPNT